MWNRVTSQLHFVGLFTALPLLAMLAVIAGASWRNSAADARNAILARESIRRLQDLLFNMQTAESNQSGYLLTNKPAYLQNFSTAVTEVEKRLRDLDRLTLTDPNDRDQLVSDLKTAAREKLNVLQETVTLAQRGKREAATALVVSDVGLRLMERVTTLEQRVEAKQRQVREVSRNKIQSQTLRGEVIATLGSVAIFTIVLLSFFQIHRLMRARRELTGKLSLAADEFRSLADCVPQFVWVLSHAGSPTYVNQEWTRFSGLSISQTTHAWQELVHPDDRSGFLQNWPGFLNRESESTAECRMKESATGKYRWFLFRAKPVVHPQLGQQWYCTYTDIDTQKNTERSLLQANSDLKQLTFAAAHDLQEPLRNVSLTLEMLLQRGGSKVDEATGLITDSLGNAQRMLGMIRDLQAYTSVFESSQEDSQDVDAGICIRHALARLEPEIRAAGGAQVHWDALPPLNIPKSHVVQLFQHLIGNAVKYRKPNAKPVIQIEAQRQGTVWTWSVADNGIGFDPAYTSRIFRLFKRLHHGQNYPGSGIGLAICERIVTFYGGHIWAESRPDHGSNFKFSLPA